MKKTLLLFKVIIFCFSFTISAQNVVSNNDFEANGGEEFLTIPCLNDDDAWIQTVTNWIEEWAFAETLAV